MRHKASFYPFSGPASLFLHHGILSDEEINQLFLSWRHLSMNSQKHLSYAKLKKDREFYKALNWCFSPSVEIFFLFCVLIEVAVGTNYRLDDPFILTLDLFDVIIS